jgi:hypothetical protein
MGTSCNTLIKRLVAGRSVRFQVLAISLVGILAFAFVAAMTWSTQLTRWRLQAETEALWSANLRVVRAGLTFETARNLGNVFLAERHPELLSREQETFARAARFLDQALAEETVPEIAARMKEVQRLMEVYQHDFAQAAAIMQNVGLQPADGVQGLMAPLIWV